MILNDLKRLASKTTDGYVGVGDTPKEGLGPLSIGTRVGTERLYKVIAAICYDYKVNSIGYTTNWSTLFCFDIKDEDMIYYLFGSV